VVTGVAIPAVNSRSTGQEASPRHGLAWDPQWQKPRINVKPGWTSSSLALASSRSAPGLPDYALVALGPPPAEEPVSPAARLKASGAFG
jgi:hypothetical protein